MMVMLGLGGSQKAGTAQTNNVRSAVGKIRKVWPWPGVSGSGSGFCVGGKAGPEGPTVSVYGWVGCMHPKKLVLIQWKLLLLPLNNNVRSSPRSDI